MPNAKRDSLLDPFVVVKKRVISTDVDCPRATLADFVFFVYRELCTTTGAYPYISGMWPFRFNIRNDLCRLRRTPDL